MIDGSIRFQHIDTTHHFVNRAEAKFGHDLTAFFRDHEQIIDNMFRFAAEFLTQFGVLCGNADRAGIEMTLPAS